VSLRSARILDGKRSPTQWTQQLCTSLLAIKSTISVHVGHLQHPSTPFSFSSLVCLYDFTPLPISRKRPKLQLLQSSTGYSTTPGAACAPFVHDRKLEYLLTTIYCSISLVLDLLLATTLVPRRSDSLSAFCPICIMARRPAQIYYYDPVLSISTLIFPSMASSNFSTLDKRSSTFESS
jgi:hypothetical protein